MDLIKFIMLKESNPNAFRTVNGAHADRNKIHLMSKITLERSTYPTEERNKSRGSNLDAVYYY
jgi:hypothetical protein